MEIKAMFRQLAVGALAASSLLAGGSVMAHAQGTTGKPNIVMLMTDDTGWNDFGAYSGGGVALGHPTPNIDRMAKEGAVFHQLVRTGELHRRPRLIHYRTHSDPFGAIDRGCSGRRELPPPGDPDDRRILQEERLHHVLLRQVAPGRQACGLSNRAWLR